MGPKFKGWYFYEKEKRFGAQRHTGHAEAEIGVMHHQTEVCLEPQEAGRSQERFSLRVF